MRLRGIILMNGMMGRSFRYFQIVETPASGNLISRRGHSFSSFCLNQLFEK
jgi:hypothetical protein